jgi:hypothetical protein
VNLSIAGSRPRRITSTPSTTTAVSSTMATRPAAALAAPEVGIICRRKRPDLAPRPAIYRTAYP